MQIVQLQRKVVFKTLSVRQLNVSAKWDTLTAIGISMQPTSQFIYISSLQSDFRIQNINSYAYSIYYLLL
jgi:hypothetical protein